MVLPFPNIWKPGAARRHARARNQEGEAIAALAVGSGPASTFTKTVLHFAELAVTALETPAR